MGRLVVWGAGELGSRVAAAWVRDGGDAVGVTATERRHAALAEAGIEPSTRGVWELLRPDDLLLLALPGHAKQLAAVHALAGVPPPARAVLISSTGYYGAPTGLVSESTLRGDADRARAIWGTEQRFRGWAGAAAVVLRLGGLYCRGRGPVAALAGSGEPPAGPPDRTLALVHYDDAATAALAALRCARPERAYLVVTPPCPTRGDFYTAACRELGLAAPYFTPPLGREPARYDVSLLRRDLLPEPAYPDWRDALRM